MPAARNAGRVVEQNPNLEAVLFDAKLTADELAKFLKIHWTTVYVLAKRGELPAFKVGTDWWFDRAEIDEWIRSRTERPEC